MLQRTTFVQQLPYVVNKQLFLSRFAVVLYGRRSHPSRQNGQMSLNITDRSLMLARMGYIPPHDAIYTNKPTNKELNNETNKANE